MNARILLDRVNDADFSGCFFVTGDRVAGAVRGRAVIRATNNAVGFTIRGCYFNSNGTGTSAFQSWVEFASAFSGALIANTIVYGSTTQQPSVAAFVYSGSTKQIYRAGNVFGFVLGGTPAMESGGFVARFSNSGSASITGAATTVVVSHQLHSTPAIGDIDVGPTTAWQAVTNWWVSNVTSTQFTINVSPSPGTSKTITFGWNAKVPSLD